MVRTLRNGNTKANGKGEEKALSFKPSNGERNSVERREVLRRKDLNEENERLFGAELSVDSEGGKAGEREQSESAVETAAGETVELREEREKDEEGNWLSPSDEIETSSRQHPHQDQPQDQPESAAVSNRQADHHITASTVPQASKVKDQKHNKDLERSSRNRDSKTPQTPGSPKPNDMIDASDFRADCSSSYATLASMNGRLTPPPGHHGHPHHPHLQHGYPNSNYTTLTPVQCPLPPISTLSSMHDKFQAYSPGPEGVATTNAGASGGSGGSFSSMHNNGLLGSPYNYDKLPIGISPPPYATPANSHMGMSDRSHSPPPPSGAPSSALSPQHNNHGGDYTKQEPLSPNSANQAGYYGANTDSSNNNTTHSSGNNQPGQGGQQQSPPHHELSPHSSSHGLDHSPSTNVPTSIYGSSTAAVDGLSSANNPSLNGMASLSPQTSPSNLLHPHSHHDLSPTSPTGLGHPGSHPGASSILAAAAAGVHPHHVLAHQLGVAPPQVGTQSHNMHHQQQGATGHQHAMISLKSSSSNSGGSGANSGGSGSGESEEINTKDLAQRISAELKRYSIPQAIFAQRVLCRSQGTLSDLLRNPKPWSKLKSGRETFRRMQKWLQEPEFQRMSSLRLAGKEKLLILLSFIFAYLHCGEGQLSKSCFKMEGWMDDI